MRLRLAGSSLADVARELGVTPTTVTSVSQGMRRSRRIEEAIAGKLNTAPAQLWPERYSPADAEGQSVHRCFFLGGAAPGCLIA